MNKYLILTQNCDARGSDVIVQMRKLAPLLGSRPKFNNFDQNDLSLRKQAKMYWTSLSKLLGKPY